MMIKACNISIFSILILYVNITSIAFANHLPQPELTISNLNKSTVKVSINKNAININYPWVGGELTQGIASAFVIDYNGEQKILTNAHVVDRAVTIRLRKVGSDIEHEATVEYISHQRDLALIVPKDKIFFENTQSLLLMDKGESVNIGDEVSSYGFPIGGKKITMTQGVISSVDFSVYAHSGYENLVYQVDAAINPGKSGGPSISRGKVVGVNFQGAEHVQNVGYIIPSSVIHEFFDDIHRSLKPSPSVNGVPFISINTIPLQNNQLRKITQANTYGQGLLVTEVSGLEKEKQLLKKNDVLLAIDDHTIGNQGNITLSSNDNISWRALISSKQLGDNVLLTIKRDGKLIYIDYPLTHNYSDSYLIPSGSPIKNIDYLVLGGTVFIEMTQSIYQLFEPYNFPHISKFQKRFRETGSSIDDRVVIMSNVLFNPVNAFYEPYRYSVLKKVDGLKIHNLVQLKDYISASQHSRKNILLESSCITGKKVIMGFTWDSLDEQRTNIIETYGPTNDVY